MLKELKRHFRSVASDVIIITIMRVFVPDFSQNVTINHHLRQPKCHNILKNVARDVQISPKLQFWVK